MIEKLIRDLGAGVGVALPAVRVTGQDPVLPSVFPLGTMAAASAGAVSAAVAAYAARHGRPAGPNSEPIPGPSSEPDLVPSPVPDLGPGLGTNSGPNPGPIAGPSSEPDPAPNPALGLGADPATDLGPSSGPDQVPGLGPNSGAGSGDPEVAIDVRHAAVAFQSERHFRTDGKPMDVWAALSGDYPASDGWVRLHCNFDHHRDAALRALGLAPGSGKAAVERACAGRTAVEVEEAVVREGGCAAAMRSRAEWLAHPQARALAGLPLVGLSRLPAPGDDRAGDQAGYRAAERGGYRAGDRGGDRADERGGDGAGDGGSSAGSHGGRAGDQSGGRGVGRGAGLSVGLSPGRGRGEVEEDGAGGGARPLSGVRVLDLTRVIAGPVAARTLAAYGADVLRVGAAHLPEVPGLVVETAFGKRSCHVDLRSETGRERLRELVRGADVVIQAYRPGTLRARGFGPDDLAALRPGVVCVDVSAYGSRGPWASRRGFDSLVQMASGIAHENGDGLRPAPLPAQALDHATGYLAAFGAVAALIRRAAEGGSWHVEVSLARTATWLDGLGRIDGGGVPRPAAEDLLATMDSPFGTLTYVTPPGLAGGVRPGWTTPPPRQGEHPAAWAL
ncbi:CoA transferase [Microbispora triticiradicis]|uniref:CoA transferase n=1 Tax=Microbispora TaxID=2005 RepID=UPI001FCBC735|nr:MULTISPECIES: CoA transferase [Microbispora]